jgi:prevent-host-death family protein
MRRTSYSTVTTIGLRDGLADVLGRVRHAGERVVVTRSGKPVAAIVPLETLRLIEKLEDEYDIAAAEEALEENVFYDLDEVLKSLKM